MGLRVTLDLRDRFGEVRDQTPRPTCMAFAASDTHAFARGNLEPLSVEYAFFHAVKRTSKQDPTKGVPFELMSQAISLDGQPLEQGWPYTKQVVAADKWKPPNNPGELFYRSSTKSSADLASIYALLDSGRPAILVMDVSESFFRATASAVVIAPPGEPRINTHAVIAVGHGENNNSRCILVRNSWGTKWSNKGYGWLEENYLKPRLLVVGVMD